MITGKEVIADLLLKNGANPDLRDKSGKTAFEDADEKGTL